MSSSLSARGKEWLFCIIFALLHLVTFFAWHRVIPVIIQVDFQQYRSFIAPVLLLVFTAALFSLTALLVRNKALLACSMIVAGLLPYAISLPSTGIAWATLAATIALLVIGAASIQKEVASSLQYRIPRFLKQGLGFYFTAAALVLSLFYLNRIDDQKVFSILFPQSLFDFALRSFSGTIQGVTGLPQIQPEQTVNEVLTEVIQAQLQSQGVSLAKISKKELGRLLDAQRADLAKNYHISLDGGEKVGAALTGAVTEKIKDLVGRYNQYLPLGAAIAFFFMFKTLSIILYFLSVFLALLLMKLLILVTIVKREKEQIEAERLVL